mmetsp:Transcript_65227/g.149392  ORF Transcript_65227/g.149392 Transcript_65227/m.149392 type:complete len:420 (-) Transcript_65227:76-1335(-)
MVFTTASAPSDTCWMLPKTVRMRSWVPGGCLFWGVSLIFALESASILFSSARTSPQESSGMRIWAVMLSLPTGVADLPVAVLRCSWSSNTSERMAAMALAILFLGPVIPTTRASVQGEKSVAFETLTRAPDLDWINLMVAPALPMIVPASLFGINSLKNFCDLSPFLSGVALPCWARAPCGDAAGAAFCAFSGDCPSPSSAPLSRPFLFFCRFFFSPPSAPPPSIETSALALGSFTAFSFFALGSRGCSTTACARHSAPVHLNSIPFSAHFRQAMSSSGSPRGCSAAACSRNSARVHLNSMPFSAHLRHTWSAGSFFGAASTAMASPLAAPPPPSASLTFLAAGDFFSRGCSATACARNSAAVHLKSMPFSRHLRHGSSESGSPRGCSTMACARHSEALHLKSMPFSAHLRHGSSDPGG